MEQFLNDIDRKCLGLEPINPLWDKVQASRLMLYYDNSILKKIICSSESGYVESDVFIETVEDRKFTVGIKSKKLYKMTPSYIENNLLYKGVYFHWHPSFISIANGKSDISYYYNLEAPKTIDELRIWLDKWVEETNSTDLRNLEEFKNSKRQRQKFKDGDFFVFKIGRREYGYGRIIFDISGYRKKCRKNNVEILPGFFPIFTPVIVSVYKIISDRDDLEIEKLEKLPSFPSELIFDNEIFYGNYRIIGNLPLNDGEKDFMIEVQGNYDYQKEQYRIYYQHGFEYYEKWVDKAKDLPPKVLALRTYSSCKDYMECLYNVEEMRKQIKENYVVYDKYDLRAPEREDDRKYLYDFFEISK